MESRLQKKYSQLAALKSFFTAKLARIQDQKTALQEGKIPADTTDLAMQSICGITPSTQAHLKDIECIEVAMQATLQAIKNIEKGKIAKTSFSQASSSFFDYHKILARRSHLSLAVLAKMPGYYVVKIDNLINYLENFHAGRQPAMSIDSILTTNPQERWNLMTLYPLIQNGSSTIEEVRALDERGRMSMQNELDQPRILKFNTH